MVHDRLGPHCAGATPCPAECVLLRQMIMRLWAKPTLITGFLLINGARHWTNTTMFMKTCLSMRMPAQWHSLAIDESDEDWSMYGACSKPFSDPDGDHDFAIRADVDLDG